MKKDWKKNIIIFLIMIGVCSTCFIFIYWNNLIKKESISISKSDYFEHTESNHFIILVSGSDLIPDSTDVSVMRKNTYKLQSAIDNVSISGGGIVLMPAGTFYFSMGGSSRCGEVYAIRLRDNVHLIGAGTDENNLNKLTILKPVHDNTGRTGSMDMFYLNNYSDSIGEYDYPYVGQKRNVSYTDVNGKEVLLKNQNLFLSNADFSNFVIDGEKTIGGTYNTTGKGFMIKLFINCDWDNIVIKNTDATGFGMDFPINSTVKNCVAINCGKSATTTNGGASGFGIGIGAMDNESIVISNCVALNNKKFGFFFEHQARFCEEYFLATKSLGFVVKDSIAGGNLYDFGGLKANDVTYQNVQSISGSKSYNYNNKEILLNKCRSPFNFSLYSVNSQFVNSNLSSYTTNLGYYEDNIKWAIDNGYVSPDDGNNFNANRGITREEALKILYRYARMNNEVLIKTTINQQEYTRDLIKNTAGFMDITIPDYLLENDNMDAILWGVNKGILSHDKAFRGNDNCSRAEFFTMLYRFAGSPKVNVKLPFIDVAPNAWYVDPIMWAYSKGITNGKNSLNTFKPSDVITKAEISIALYRYNSDNSNYSISYSLDNNSSNIKNYNSGNLPYTLSNPVRDGYVFKGWTGSNGNVPNDNVTIDKNTRGNLSYVANWEAVIKSVNINSYPTKVEYSVGDEMDISGLSLKVEYSDGSINYVMPVFNKKYKFTSRGNKLVKFSYYGHPIEYRVVVK